MFILTRQFGPLIILGTLLLAEPVWAADPTEQAASTQPNVVVTQTKPPHVEAPHPFYQYGRDIIIVGLLVAFGTKVLKQIE